MLQNPISPAIRIECGNQGEQRAGSLSRLGWSGLMLVCAVGVVCLLAVRAQGAQNACVPASDTTKYSSPYGFDPRAALSLGQSFDPVDPTQNHNRCLSTGGIQAVPNSSGASGITVQIANDRDEFYNSVGLSVAASARYGLASLSASFSNLDQRSFDQFSLNFVVTAYADLGLYEMIDPQLKAPIADLLAQGRSDLARDRCGSAYVNNVRQKISYSLVYSFQNMSGEERQALAAALTAAYGGGVGGIDAQLEAAYNQVRQSLSSRTRSRVDFFANGGGVAALNMQACLIGADLYTLSSIKDCLVDFTNAVANNPAAAAASDFFIAPISDFGVVPCFQQGVKRRDEINGDIRIAHEDGLATEKMLIGLYGDVQLGLAKLETPLTEVANALAAYGGYVTQLELLFESCVGDVAENFINCRRPAEASPPILPPSLPSDVVEALYDRHQWSLYRWCTALRDGTPGANGSSPAGKMTGAILNQLSLSTQSCAQTLGAISNGVPSLVLLRGQNNNLDYPLDMRPLASLTGLRSLRIEDTSKYINQCYNGVSIVGNPGQHCVTPAYAYTCLEFTGPQPSGVPWACEIGRGFGAEIIEIDALWGLDELEVLRLRGIGVIEDHLDTLLGASWANLETLDLGNNRIYSFDHPWPLSLEELVLDNNHLGLELLDHADITQTFLPMTRLKLLDVRDQEISGVPGAPTLSMIPPKTAVDPVPCYQYAFSTSYGQTEEATTNNIANLAWGLYDAFAAQEVGGRLDAENFVVKFNARGYGATAATCNACKETFNTVSQNPVFTCSPLTDGEDPIGLGGSCSTPGIGCLDTPGYFLGLW